MKVLDVTCPRCAGDDSGGYNPAWPGQAGVPCDENVVHVERAELAIAIEEERAQERIRHAMSWARQQALKVVYQEIGKVAIYERDGERLFVDRALVFAAIAAAYVSPAGRP